MLQDTEIDDELSMRRYDADGEHEKNAKNARRSVAKLTINSSSRERKISEKPAELFRKDLISAMKMPDTEQLIEEKYLLLAEAWKQDWEKGVQVPVNTSQKISVASHVAENLWLYGSEAFKLPKKLLYAAKDDYYDAQHHELQDQKKLAGSSCRYDLDAMDAAWLQQLNLELLASEMMEKLIEEIETQCYETMEKKKKTAEGLGIEYDENVVCDVCNHPDAEEGNEMLFCDNCDVCVHQACYGIMTIPEGNWLCRPCSIGVTPQCVLCAKPGGALKATKKGKKWAHVSCCLWIPEVKLGCPVRMEPVENLSSIEPKRLTLVCTICREKKGACIQCNVKVCKTAFHITCAFSQNLVTEWKKNPQNENDVFMRALCPKHTKEASSNERPGSPPGSPVTHPVARTTPRKEEMSEEKQKEWREKKRKEFEEDFYLCVNVKQVAEATGCVAEIVDFVYNYWLLKRKTLFNAAILPPQHVEGEQLAKQREVVILARIKMFLHLRQDLERVRNLCYMVTRREKTRRAFYQTKQEVFRHQVSLFSKDDAEFTEEDLADIRTAHRSTPVYDEHQKIISLAEEYAKYMENGDSLSYTMTPEKIIPKPQGDEYIPIVNHKRGRYSLAKVARGGLDLHRVPKKRGRKPKIRPSVDSCPAVSIGPGGDVIAMETDDVDIIGLDDDASTQPHTSASVSTEPAEDAVDSKCVDDVTLYGHEERLSDDSRVDQHMADLLDTVPDLGESSPMETKYQVVCDDVMDSPDKDSTYQIAEDSMEEKYEIIEDPPVDDPVSHSGRSSTTSTISCAKKHSTRRSSHASTEDIGVTSSRTSVESPRPAGKRESLKLVLRTCHNAKWKAVTSSTRNLSQCNSSPSRSEDEVSIHSSVTSLNFDKADLRSSSSDVKPREKSHRRCTSLSKSRERRRSALRHAWRENSSTRQKRGKLSSTCSAQSLRLRSSSERKKDEASDVEPEEISFEIFSQQNDRKSPSSTAEETLSSTLEDVYAQYMSPDVTSPVTVGSRSRPGKTLREIDSQNTSVLDSKTTPLKNSPTLKSPRAKKSPKLRISKGELGEYQTRLFDDVTDASIPQLKIDGPVEKSISQLLDRLNNDIAASSRTSLGRLKSPGNNSKSSPPFPSNDKKRKASESSETPASKHQRRQSLSDKRKSNRARGRPQRPHGNKVARHETESEAGSQSSQSTKGSQKETILSKLAKMTHLDHLVVPVHIRDKLRNGMRQLSLRSFFQPAADLASDLVQPPREKALSPTKERLQQRGLRPTTCFRHRTRPSLVAETNEGSRSHMRSPSPDLEMPRLTPEILGPRHSRPRRTSRGVATRNTSRIQRSDVIVSSDEEIGADDVSDSGPETRSRAPQDNLDSISVSSSRSTNSSRESSYRSWARVR